MKVDNMHGNTVSEGNMALQLELTIEELEDILAPTPSIPIPPPIQIR